MSTLKRATKKLREAGIEHITVEKGLWGASLYDHRLRKQRSICHKTPQEAVDAAIGGERPIQKGGEIKWKKL